MNNYTVGHAKWRVHKLQMFVEEKYKMGHFALRVAPQKGLIGKSQFNNKTYDKLQKARKA